MPLVPLIMEIDKVYVVYHNSDGIEGRGQMVRVFDSGFFLSEDEAWDFADTLPGIMGRRPRSGSWRNEQFPDIEVRVIHRHSEQRQRVRQKINELRERANKLEQSLRD